MEFAGRTPRIGVALIGAGMIAKTHVAALSDARNCAKLIAVVSTRPVRAAHLAAFYEGDAPVFTADLGRVIDDPAIKVVIVATPPNVRIDLIEALARAGKHILLEKPVARTAAEALQVVEICERAGVTLGVLFQHRMRASSLQAARLIAQGQMGDLGYAEISVPLWRDQSYYDALGRGTYVRDGGGVMITQAIHTIDLALSLTGPVDTVQGMTATTNLHRMEAEDFAVAGLRFTSGAVGSFIASTARFPHGSETINLHFAQGSLHLSAQSLTVFWRDGRVETVVQGANGGDDNGPSLADHAGHHAMIVEFVEAISAGRPPVVTGREALAAHYVIEAIAASSEGGRPIAR